MGTIQPEKSSKADMLSFLTLAILILLDPHQFVSCQRRSRNQEDYYRRRHRVPTIQEDCIKENAVNKTEELTFEVEFNDEGEFGNPGKTIGLGPVGAGYGTEVSSFDDKDVAIHKKKFLRVAQVTVWEQKYRGDIVCSGLQFKYWDEAGNPYNSKVHGGYAGCLDGGCKVGEPNVIQSAQGDDNPITQITVWSNNFINKIEFETPNLKFSCGQTEAGRKTQWKPQMDSGTPREFRWMSGYSWRYQGQHYISDLTTFWTKKVEK